MSYRYSSLVGSIDDKQSPLRQYLEHRFPNLRPLQSAFRADAGPLRVAGGSPGAGTIGAAFDYMVRLTLDGSYRPEVATAAFKPDQRTTINDIATIGGEAAVGCRTAEAPDTLMQAGWVLALCTEIYRNPFLIPDHPLTALLHAGQFTVPSLMRLLPDDAARQLVALHLEAISSFYPSLADSPVRLALGPTFAASALCPADADLIIDGTLIDLKTRLGTLNRKTGIRHDGISLPEVYQLLGYVLFDTANKYEIDSVALYSARYGHLFRLPLSDFLATLAGGRVDLGVERIVTWELLGGK